MLERLPQSSTVTRCIRLNFAINSNILSESACAPIAKKRREGRDVLKGVSALSMLQVYRTTVLMSSIDGR